MGVATADGHACSEKISVLLLQVVETLAPQVFLVGDDIAPVLYAHHRVERMGVISDGIEAADDAAHRRAGNDVDWYPCLFENLQHADMSHAFCAATA